MPSDTISITDVINKLIAGEPVRIKGLGIFKSKMMLAKKGRNPRTGETIELAERRKVTFSMSSTLKAAINKNR